MSKKYYQYIVHCSVVFSNPLVNTGLPQEEIDEHLEEFAAEILEKLEFNYQIYDLEIKEGNWNDRADASSEDCLTCLFDFQHSLTRKELEQDSEGDEDDLAPTEEALLELEKEFKPIFSDYDLKSMEFFANFEDFMGDVEE